MGLPSSSIKASMDNALHDTNILCLIFAKCVPPWYKLLTYVFVCRKWSESVRCMTIEQCKRLAVREPEAHETATQLVHAVRVARYARAFYKPLQRYTLNIHGRRIGIEFRILLGEVYAIESPQSGPKCKLLSSKLRILIASDRSENRFVASDGSVHVISIDKGNVIMTSDGSKADLLREICPV